MTHIKNLLFLLIIFGLVSCKKPITEFKASEISEQVSVANDPYSSTNTFVGMPVGGYEYMIGSTYYRIRSFKSVAGMVSHQIYVTIDYSYGWQFFNRANLLGGEALDFTVINREVLRCSTYGCDYKEELGISVTDAKLREFLNSGMRIRLYAKSGNTRDIWVTPNYIKAQLDVVQNG